ncbi:hypothetical protein JOC86_001025 [Bacillus pakistanensis]|uniref:Uncharacterized protein n=1 Tax=Rossellomorea pakistanensis TaxID=992288 RepID=A0ABS2N9G9_9BACI|nr:hypothetical protein [Bacillus pakistanensis]
MQLTHYSEFNETDDYFAEAFTKTHRVYLVSLKEMGNSEKAFRPYQLSMLETISWKVVMFFNMRNI